MYELDEQEYSKIEELLNEKVTLVSWSPWTGEYSIHFSNGYIITGDNKSGYFIMGALALQERT